MNAPECLCLPTFKFNWPDACSPHAQEVEEHVNQWVNEHQLISDSRLRARTLRARYGWLAARCYPEAPFDLLTTIADYIAWLFLVDDLFFDRVQPLSSRTVPHITAIIDVLDLNTVQPVPVYGEQALLDICQRLRRHLGTERFQQFAHGTRMIYGSAAIQILAHLNSTPITLRQYQCIRRHGSGVIPCMMLIKCALGEPFEATLQGCPEVEQLEESTNTILSLSNDIYSLAMELEQPGYNVNMVTLLAGSPQALQQGIDLTAKNIQTEIDRFTQLSEHLLAHASLPLKHYIQGLRHWLSGHQRWIERDTARYAIAFVHSDADQREVAYELQCADSRTAR